MVLLLGWCSKPRIYSCPGSRSGGFFGTGLHIFGGIGFNGASYKQCRGGPNVSTGYAVAQSFGVDIMPFVLAVAFGASASFLTPHGYATNLIVQNVAAYRRKDYLRWGAPSLCFTALAFLPCCTRFIFRLVYCKAGSLKAKGSCRYEISGNFEVPKGIVFPART